MLYSAKLVYNIDKTKNKCKFNIKLFNLDVCLETLCACMSVFWLLLVHLSIIYLLTLTRFLSFAIVLSMLNFVSL